ncbi:hypothetical protein A2311_05870 [candidate division WOR-1 bacterium RIFOXYB2_FULL_48_7]|uniref:Peptidase C39-like domain-containing protein n=1 Tax=candidate division WOR-1 bacterium RIFOXYB2_FULL_48_7 TaxID=1802583 RepID=A0A1F4T9V2_UNCSA|nr:MAG: hypothetical protein A2311_05870 [candidate division WOR-1 bacterium RIFOXYB2_FULL_48_7]
MNRIFVCLISWLLCLAGLLAAPALGKNQSRVPFLCQAPYGNWAQPWQDACEEAALLMAAYHTQGKLLTNKAGKAEILKMVAYQRRHFGGHYDLTAQQAVDLANGYFPGQKLLLMQDVKLPQLIAYLDEGNIIVAPMAGKLLHNPFFTPPGPAYHYLVIIGFDPINKEFITNDPGTRRGKGYRYKYSVLYNAIHDWTGDKRTINSGRKNVIVVK